MVLQYNRGDPRLVRRDDDDIHYVCERNLEPVTESFGNFEFYTNFEQVCHPLLYILCARVHVSDCTSSSNPYHHPLTAVHRRASSSSHVRPLSARV